MINMKLPYASPWKRLGALLIDSVILLIVGGILGAVIGAMASPAAWRDPLFESRLNGIGLLLTWLYYAFLESSSKQGTLGKEMLGLRVVALDGQSISFWRATGRFFGRILSALIFCSGFFVAFFTQKRQALHDMMAGCLVLDTNDSPVSVPQNVQYAPVVQNPVASHLAATVSPVAPMPAHPAQAPVSMCASPVLASSTMPTNPTPAQPINVHSLLPFDEDAIYETVANEMDGGKMDRGLWTRLYAEHDGDEKKTKIAYIKQRAEKLMVAQRAEFEESLRRQAELVAEQDRLRKLSRRNEILDRMEKGEAALLPASNFLGLVLRGDVQRVSEMLSSDPLFVGVKYESSGDTALHIAVREVNLAMVRLLLEAGAPVIVANYAGKTPVDLAEKHSEIHSEITAAM